MKTLREQFDEIINRPDAGRGGDEIVEELLQTVKQREHTTQPLNHSSVSLQISTSYRLPAKRKI